MHTRAALKQQQLGRSLGAEAPLVMPEGIDISLCLNTHTTVFGRSCLQHPEMSHPEDRLADLQMAVALLYPLLLSSACLVAHVQKDEHADLTALVFLQELIGLEPWQQPDASGDECSVLML